MNDIYQKRYHYIEFAAIFYKIPRDNHLKHCRHYAFEKGRDMKCQGDWGDPGKA